MKIIKNPETRVVVNNKDTINNKDDNIVWVRVIIHYLLKKALVLVD